MSCVGSPLLHYTNNYCNLHLNETIFSVWFRFSMFFRSIFGGSTLLLFLICICCQRKLQARTLAMADITNHESQRARQVRVLIISIVLLLLLYLLSMVDLNFTKNMETKLWKVHENRMSSGAIGCNWVCGQLNKFLSGSWTVVFSLLKCSRPWSINPENILFNSEFDRISRLPWQLRSEIGFLTVC